MVRNLGIEEAEKAATGAGARRPPGGRRARARENGGADRPQPPSGEGGGSGGEEPPKPQKPNKPRNKRHGRPR